MIQQQTGLEEESFDAVKIFDIAQSDCALATLPTYFPYPTSLTLGDFSIQLQTINRVVWSPLFYIGCGQCLPFVFLLHI